ncbi:ATP-dependent nuclease [Thermoanaerobacter mathranii]|uniref:ATP-dependent nuclease n=1 Tax=Thermoanaerobacter mathranii TaxID=583357 RepID=UPI003AAF2DB5
MKIIGLQIKNFRNLDDVKMLLHPDINFLVGENDLGKSNFLDMLDIIFNGRRFKEDDFFDKEKPIEIQITLGLDDIEKGIFGDLFDPQNSDVINIMIRQETPDEDIRYFHRESEEEIHYSDFRCVNFIKYDSLRSPKEELTFYRGKGVGKFLNYLVEKFFKNMEQNILDIEDFIKKDQIDQIVSYINQKLEKLKTFKKFGIVTSIEGEAKSLIYRLLTMKDSKGLDIQKMGYGVQFLTLVILSIMEKIMYLLEDKRRQKCVYSLREKENVQNYISLILGLDEPEIHLHPYMQRSLIKYIYSILLNENAEFSSLLKELFNIDKILGQAIIVTHSPNILLNDYRQIVRFYPFQGYSIKIKSGVEIKLNSQEEKHLLMNFPYIKEAFFSKCVIVVEGETEFGALPIWGEKILGDMDEYGISIIKAGGKKSAIPVSKLLEQFDIYNIPIIDKDTEPPEDYDNLITTNQKDFEEEVVEKLLNKNKELLFQLIEAFDDKGLERKIQKGKLKQIAERYKINIDWDEKDYKFSEIHGFNNLNLTKAMFLAWLDINKSVILGRFIGEKLERSYIPEPYLNAIKKAKGVAGE